MGLLQLITTLFLLHLFSNPTEAVHRNGIFTHLKNDNTPCHAENLKEATRYICSRNFEVICLSGWKEPDDAKLISPFNPCPIPICEYNNQTCEHGECVRPNVCACDVGWEGHLCDKCVPLPNCQHGTCDKAFECNCETDSDDNALWQGAYCHIPACTGCTNGECFEPNICTCDDGWSGTNCTICEPLNGCRNGKCKKITTSADETTYVPGTCECQGNWTGHLCDQPVCRDGCSNTTGYCDEPGQCLCKMGWKGDNCDECVKYHDCPGNGTCIEPNQCICGSDCNTNDDGYDNCNREIINGPHFGPWSECDKEKGERTRACRWWNYTGSNVTCSDGATNTDTQDCP